MGMHRSLSAPGCPCDHRSVRIAVPMCKKVFMFLTKIKTVGNIVRNAHSAIQVSTPHGPHRHWQVVCASIDCITAMFRSSNQHNCQLYRYASQSPGCTELTVSDILLIMRQTTTHGEYSVSRLSDRCLLNGYQVHSSSYEVGWYSFLVSICQ